MEKVAEKQNLGSGSIPGLMIKLAVPTIIAQLVNLLYNMVDRIYIGHIRDKVFAVFLAEPVSDFISVAVASTLFLCNIKKILAKA